MGMEAVNDKINYFRVHQVGTGYGPPNDSLDAEVIVGMEKNKQLRYGFKLRNDNNAPVAQAMFALLQDAYNSNAPITIEYDRQPGRNNFQIVRVIRVR